ncbi:hypothetical protein J537_3745 [Acinetobacter baumannii 1437282]|nr:hypothetical protein J537_3745 [Acinetobacter baumannii 1437282]
MIVNKLNITTSSFFHVIFAYSDDTPVTSAINSKISKKKSSFDKAIK